MKFIGEFSRNAASVGLICFAAISLYACGNSVPKKEAVEKLISDSINNMPNRGRPGLLISDTIKLESVELVDQRVDGDKLTAIVNLKAKCKIQIHADYLEFFGGDNSCNQVGQEVGNQVTFTLVKFESGWRVQPKSRSFFIGG